MATVDQTLSSVHSLYTYFNKPNKKYEVLREETSKSPLETGRFKGLMSVVWTRWLSYTGTTGRALDTVMSKHIQIYTK